MGLFAGLFNINEENENEMAERLSWLLQYCAKTVGLGYLTLDWSFYERLLSVLKGPVRAVQRFLGLEARRCSYCRCLALRRGEEVGQEKRPDEGQRCSKLWRLST